jgi:hypothetical protein
MTSSLRFGQVVRVRQFPFTDPDLRQVYKDVLGLVA